MTNAVIITGCNGGIGQALVQVFADADWFVIGVDCVKGGAVAPDLFIQADIGRFCTDETVLVSFAERVRAGLGGRKLAALVNNAAMQVLGATSELKISDVVASMNVNALAPFALVKTFLPELKANKGSVINIGSVHAQSTKPEFVAYASSKAALHGLTRALAVDLGPEVRVNTLAPAATATAMLKAGFEGKPAGLNALEDVHPLKRLAQPAEIARLALFLTTKDAAFLTGSTFYADGGILSRLHDPI